MVSEQLRDFCTSVADLECALQQSDGFWTIRRFLRISGRFRRCNAQFQDVSLISQGLTGPTMIFCCVTVRLGMTGEHGTLRVA